MQDMQDKKCSFLSYDFYWMTSGTVEEVPVGHVHQTLLVGGSGVRSAQMRWGEILMRAAGGGKKRSMQW